MQIIPLPLLTDNYAWLCVDEADKTCCVVDPSEGPPVAAAIAERGLTLKSILITHHHADHTGGVSHLAQAGIDVVASAYDHERQRTPKVTHAVRDGEAFSVLGAKVHTLGVPGHTLGAVAFYMPAWHAVFTGDTLFLAGCGRLFEGTPEQMHGSLQSLASLPADTQVYCGHEYTEKNLSFAASLEPANPVVRERLQAVSAHRRQGLPTVPAPLSVERATNPFLRVTHEAMQKITKETNPVSVLANLRRQRDSF